MLDVEIRFDEDRTQYQPGETVRGRYRVVGDDAAQVERVEVSILWYTSGKGDEDLGVEQYQELRQEQPKWRSPVDWNTFSCTLPQTPLSYDGVLLKVLWCVRVRAYPPSGNQAAGELAFRVGSVARGQKVETKL